MGTTNFDAIQLSAGQSVSAFFILSQSINIASVAANTSAEQTFTVAGLAVGDAVWVSKPTLSAGLVIGNARVSAANTLALTLGNLTAAPIDPAAENYIIGVMRAG